MTIRTGGQVFVESLIQNEVNDLFLIPGVQLDWAVEALREKGEAIRLYVPRHEQTTTYMADGYSRVSGKPGVAMVVPGPGVLNAGAGLATAYACNSKVLFLTAQIRSNAIGKGYGLLHEIPDQSGVIRSLCKAHYLAESGNVIASSVDAAFKTLSTGRPRPVGLEIPHDFLETEAGNQVALQAKHREPELPELNKKQLEAAADLLNKARLPVIYAGGGILAGKAQAELIALAEKIGAPVVMSDNARGVIDDRHPLALNSLAGRAVFEKADVVLVVGSRFMDALAPAPSWPQKDIQYIYINIDANDLIEPRVPTVALHADAGLALTALHDLLAPRTVLSNAQAQAVKDWAAAQIQAVSPQSAYITAMRNALPEEGIFVNELTQVGYLARVAFPVYTPGSYIAPGYQGTLGYGFPTALGAAVAGGGRRVLSITGDGGFGWNLQELATAARYQLPVTLVVFNDGYYGNVRAIQKRVFGKEVAVELANPDFQQLAQAFGVSATKVDTPDALGAAIKASCNQPGPSLIEVAVGDMPSPWPLLRLQPMPGTQSSSTPANPL